MKKFLVKIVAYDYSAEFYVLSLDNPESLEKSILDKLGENSITWEYMGDMYDTRKHRITYEEVINGGDNATLTKSIPGKEGSRSSVGAGAS